MSHGILFCDSFEKWQSDSDHHGKWNSTYLCSTTTEHARTGERSLYIPTGPYPRVVKALHDIKPNFCVAAAFRAELNNTTQGYTTLFELNNLGTFTNVFSGVYPKWIATRLVLNKDGNLIVQVQSTISSVVTVPLYNFPVATNISFGKWYHIALEVGPTMSLETENYWFYPNAKVYVNEKEHIVGGGAVTWLEEDDSVTLPRFVPTACYIGRSHYSVVDAPFIKLWVDDFYISETFAGDLEIDVIEPEANATNLWTPSTGTNWEAVKKVFPSDTPYVYKDYDKSPAQEVCEMDDVNDVDEVVAIQGVLIGKKTHGSTGIVAPNYVQTGTEKGDDKYLGTDSICFTDLQELNPETDTNWTPTEVDNLKYGFSDEYPE